MRVIFVNFLGGLGYGAHNVGMLQLLELVEPSANRGADFRNKSPLVIQEPTRVCSLPKLKVYWPRVLF